MSFKTKADPFNLSVEGLQVSDTTENRSVQNAEAPGENGFIVAVETFGEKIAPNANYVLTKSSIALNSIVLGSKGENGVMLGSVSISTSAGSAPTVSASGQQVESGTGLANHKKVTLPNLTLSGLHDAQSLGLFTISSDKAHLTSCTIGFECDISPVDVDGETVASDVVGGKITVSGTIVLADPSAAKPEVTLAEIGGKTGHFTTPVTETNPNGDFPTYSFNAEWPLAADVAK